MNWQTLKIYGAIILATLIGVEFFARVYDWAPRLDVVAAGDNHGLSRYNYSTEGFGDLVPGQDGHWVIWFHRPYHVQTNSVGLRNTEEPFDKAFRILALGDSQTFGVFLANEDTWPAWTENYLRQRDRSAERIQVFNAGIIGYTILDELEHLKDKGIAFKPRLVILGVFENDLRDMLKEKNGAKKRPTNKPLTAIANTLKTIGRNSAVVSLANRLKSRIQLARAGVDVHGGIHGGTGWVPPSATDAALGARYTTNFRDMVELLKSRMIALAVIFIPAVDSMDIAKPSAMEPVIRAETAATGTPYLDLTEIFRAQHDAVSRLYLLRHGPNGELIGDGHLSREGNAVAGRALADWLVEKRLVP